MKSILLFLLTLLPYSMYGQTIRILPLGNSITRADNTHYSYRFRLWEKLRDAGVNFDFVGTMNSNYGGNPTFPDPAFDKDHEGHRGWRADQLLGGLPTWLQDYTPDVVLIHAGTNDVFMGNTITSTVEEIKGIIDALRADNPDVSILLAKIIGTTAPENARVIELNSKMDGIAAQKTSARSIVKVVDQYSGFNPATDTYDGKHPNAAGEEKMAEKWFQALMTVIDVPSPGNGSGLSAQYFNTKDFSGVPVVKRVDPQINFDWKTGSPGGGVNVNYFSVRWTGTLEAPVSGNYTFSTISDDGVRLWVDDVLVIDNWTYHGTTTDNSPPIALTAGRQYPVRMEFFENRGGAVAKLLWAYPGQAQQPVPQNYLYPETNSGENEPPAGTGLAAVYYNTRDLTGPIILSRLDPQVNFDWIYGSPGTGVNVNYYSARWTGWVEAPATGGYTFSTVSDDGVRLWVNDILVIDNWTNHSARTDNSAPISLSEGTHYSLRMEYYENKGGAVAKLLWTYSGQPQQPIPQDKLYPSAQAADTQAPSAPTGLSASAITENSFSLSWHVAPDPEGVTGYEVFRDANSLGTVSGTSINITGLSPGTLYTVSVRARDAAGNWSLTSDPLEVATAPQSEENPGSGLNADYYSSLDLSGPVVLNRIDPMVNFDWRYAAPGAGLDNNLFSTRWSGWLQAPVTGDYVFSTVSDDGVRLWVDNALVINNWTNHGTTTDTGAPIPLTAGQYYEIRMEYYERGGSAVAKLSWMYPGQTQQPIPPIRLYANDPGTDVGALSLMTIDGSASSVSSNLEIEASQISSEDVSIYPNPATADNLHIAIYADRETESQITITSPDKIVKTQIFKRLMTGDNLLEIPIGELNAGMYVVTISRGPVRIVKKIFVRK